MSNEPTITALIIARDEADMIANCIETVAWCDETILLDNGSIDATPQLAEQAGCRVISFKSNNFAQLRNEILTRAKTDWVIYLDADERVTPQLAQEIKVQIETTSANAIKIKRKNIAYGYELNHGGFGDETVTRIFRRQDLEGWFGQIHESPKFSGEVVQLHKNLIHLTHRSTEDNLRKSADWTKLEAELLAAKAETKPVSFLTLVRKGLMEFLRRAYFKKGYRDGMAGMVEAVVQAMNRIMVYIQVWELQQKPSLQDRYQNLDKEIILQWQQYQQKFKKQ